MDKLLARPVSNPLNSCRLERAAFQAWCDVYVQRHHAFTAGNLDLRRSMISRSSGAMAEALFCGCSMRRSYQRCTVVTGRVIPAFADAACAVCFHVFLSARAVTISSCTICGSLSIQSDLLLLRLSPTRGRWESCSDLSRLLFFNVASLVISNSLLPRKKFLSGSAHSVFSPAVAR